MRPPFYRQPSSARRWAPLLGVGITASALIAACSDGVEPATTAPAEDAGSESAVVFDASPADVTEAGLDCAADRDADGLARHLACVGLFADFTQKTIAPENRPFTPGLEFWSDGATKQRFVYLPPGTTIDTTSFDAWIFPTGTRLFKEFKLVGKRIETRLYEKTAAGWKHATYLWNADETDAVRTSKGARIAIPGRTPYEVPKSEDCDYCHSGRAEPVLGFEALSLGVAKATGVTLGVLTDEGRLSPAPLTKTLTIPDDGTARAAEAVGWLHANCGHCHNDHPKAAAFGTTLRMLVRPSDLAPVDGGAATARELPVYSTGVCKPSERDAPGGGRYLFFAGGSPTTSLAAILLGARATPGSESVLNQMPPIVTHMIDPTGKKLVDDWIAALPPCF